MSSRISSDFGSLGARVAQTRAAAEGAPRTGVRHVWVRGEQGWEAGILLRWIQRPDGELGR